MGVRGEACERGLLSRQAGGAAAADGRIWSPKSRGQNGGHDVKPSKKAARREGSAARVRPVHVIAANRFRFRGTDARRLGTRMGLPRLSPERRISFLRTESAFKLQYARTRSQCACTAHNRPARTHTHTLHATTRIQMALLLPYPQNDRASGSYTVHCKTLASTLTHKPGGHRTAGRRDRRRTEGGGQRSLSRVLARAPAQSS